MEQKMQMAYKYRIYPTNSQKRTLENQFSMCRHLYNWSLDERIEFYKTKGAALNYYHQQMYLPILKKDRPWYNTIYSQVLQDVLKRLDLAYKHFFRRVAKGDLRKGFPKFKNSEQWSSITFPQYNTHPTERIRVPKIGHIKLVLHREVPETARVKTLTISKEGAKWFACYSVTVQFQIESKQSLKPIGISFGIGMYISDSTGWAIAAKQHLIKNEEKLKTSQLRLSSSKKGTKRFDDRLKTLRKVHYKVKCCRNDFLHKTANKILDKSDTIFYEKLAVNPMINHPEEPIETNEWNKLLLDASFSKFIEIIKYKAKLLGKNAIGVAPLKDSVPIGEYRGQNSASNILRIGLDSLE